jgi:hypothetical protein
VRLAAGNGLRSCVRGMGQGSIHIHATSEALRLLGDLRT